MAIRPWGPTEYKNDLVSIEYGSTENLDNSHYQASLSPKNHGSLNGIELFIADPKIMLRGCYVMLEKGVKKNNEEQQFIIEVIENFIARDSGC